MASAGLIRRLKAVHISILDALGIRKLPIYRSIDRRRMYPHSVGNFNSAKCTLRSAKANLSCCAVSSQFRYDSAEDSPPAKSLCFQSHGNPHFSSKISQFYQAKEGWNYVDSPRFRQRCISCMSPIFSEHLRAHDSPSTCVPFAIVRGIAWAGKLTLDRLSDDYTRVSRPESPLCVLCRLHRTLLEQSI